jgi:hypothetical protein
MVSSSIPPFLLASNSSSYQEGLSAIRTPLFAAQLLASLHSLNTLTLGYGSRSDEEDLEAFRNAGLDMQKWSTELFALLDTALQESCPAVFIAAVDDLFALSSHQPRTLKFWTTFPETACRKCCRCFRKPKIPLSTFDPRSSSIPICSAGASVRSKLMVEPSKASN